MNRFKMDEASAALLKRLHEIIPDGAGSVSVNFFADGTWELTLELYGAKVATVNERGVAQIRAAVIRRNNPDWLEEVKELVEKIKEELNAPEPQ